MVGREQADVRNLSDVMHAIETYEPDIVVNCAAVTDVNMCERAPEHALGVNALGAANIAIVCRMKGVSLAHISTDYVFSGNNGPKSAGDETYPVNAYGLSKLLGEQAVLSLMPDNAAVIRVGWLYGVEYPQSQPMVAATQSDEHSHAYVYDNIKGNPTFVGHAASAVNKVIYYLEKADWESTILHVSSRNLPVTWFELLEHDFNIVPMKDGKYRGRQVETGQQHTWRPTLGGLVPSEGWELPDYRIGLDMFLKEFREAFPQKTGDGA
jgi:dTDP-4-dehydrorhamnose reductase